MSTVIPQCTSCKTKDCYINRFASSSWKKIIEQLKTTKKYKKGQSVFREGDKVDGIYFIYKGKIKIYNSGPKGRVMIVRLANTGEIFGHRGFGKKMIYPISAAALEDSMICFIPLQSFSDSLYHNPDLMYHLMFFYADELKRAEYKLRSLSMMTAKQKVAEVLLTTRSIFGTIRSDGHDWIDISLSRQELADISGISLEEIIRTLSMLKKEGAIAISAKAIAIANEKVLSALLEGFDNLLLP
jgi:CRP-like cAMP-binding protein